MSTFREHRGFFIRSGIKINCIPSFFIRNRGTLTRIFLSGVVEIACVFGRVNS